MDFNELLSRASEPTLQELMGEPALRLINLLDPSLMRPVRLRQLVSGLHSPSSLLRNPATRRSLLELLPQPNAEALAAQLQLGTTNDAYGDLASARIKKGSSAEQRLFAFFGISEDNLAPEQLAEPVRLTTPTYSLFDYQRRAMREVIVKLRAEPRRVLLHMPTGAGKTRTAMAVIAQHLREKEPRLAVWLAYGEELCEQAATEFETAWRHSGDRELHIYRYWGNRLPNLENASDGLVVAGLAKTYSAARANPAFLAKLADRTSLAIIDEAHQAIAATYRTVLQTLFFKQGETSLLGLTATPGRTYNNMESDQELADFFEQEKVGLHVDGYTNPVTFLVDNGYLARTEFSPLLSHAGLELSAKDLRDLSDKLDLPEHVLQELAANEQRNLAIVVKAEELLKRHSRLLIFAATVQHSKLLATVLQARGNTADSVTAETDPETRNRVISQFKGPSSEPMILCNYGVLTTGFDAPRTSAAIIARPTKSLLLFSQMVGRASRGPKAGGNTKAEIVTVIDVNLPGFRSPSEAFENWEDVWQ